MTGVLLAPFPTSLLKLKTIPSMRFWELFSKPKNFQSSVITCDLGKGKIFLLLLLFSSILSCLTLTQLPPTKMKSYRIAPHSPGCFATINVRATSCTWPSLASQWCVLQLMRTNSIVQFIAGWTDPTISV